jgi:hypothetical protein
MAYRAKRRHIGSTKYTCAVLTIARPLHTGRPTTLDSFKRQAGHHDLDQGIGEAYVNTCLPIVLRGSFLSSDEC